MNRTDLTPMSVGAAAMMLLTQIMAGAPGRDQPVTGMAVFNVAPEKAGVYSNKMECLLLR